MSLIDSIKKIAGDTLVENAQELMSNNAEQLVSKFIKEQLSSGNVTPIQNIVTELIGEQGSIGGLDALINKFDAVNLGSLVQSWVGLGKNIPITIQQVKSVLGEDWIRTIAEKTGFNATILTALIAKFLPSVVDTITKDGKIPEKQPEGKIDVTELLTSLIK